MPARSQDLRRHVQELAFGQAGYFTAAQAVSIGYSYQSQKYHVDHGNWLRVDRGLFRLPGWPTHGDDSFVRWGLWSGGRGVVAHASALVVHDLSDINPSRVHLTVPAGFRAADPAVVTHSGVLSDDDVEVRDSWRVTTVDRTLSDVAGSDLSQEIVDAAVAEAIVDGRMTRRRLLRRSSDADDRTALRLERALARHAGL